MICLLKSKIRDIKITSVNLEYEGSIMIDELLLKKSNIFPYEQVDVVNLNNGNRLTTYAIAGNAGSGVVQLNGAAARAGMPNDPIMVICYTYLNEERAINHKPVIVSALNNREFKI